MLYIFSAFLSSYTLNSWSSEIFIRAVFLNFSLDKFSKSSNHGVRVRTGKHLVPRLRLNPKSKQMFCISCEGSIISCYAGAIGTTEVIIGRGEDNFVIRGNTMTRYVR